MFDHCNALKARAIFSPSIAIELPRRVLALPKRIIVRVFKVFEGNLSSQEENGLFFFLEWP